MNALRTALLDPATRPQVVDALVQLAESQVSAMRGISGTMTKTASRIESAGEWTGEQRVSLCFPS